MKPYTTMLSPTEKEITEQIAMGNSMKEIAAERYRSVETIKTHIKNIRTKWNARGVVDITRIYTIENADKMKMLIAVLFLGIQVFFIVPDNSAQLRRSRTQRTVRVRSKRKNE